MPITITPPPGGSLAARAPSSQVAEANDVWRLTQIVDVRSANGTAVTYPVQVRVAMARGAGEIVSGDTTTSVNGVATFPALRMKGKGDGFLAEFVAPGFTSATREYFISSASGGLSLQVVDRGDSVVAGGGELEIDLLGTVTSGLTLGSVRVDVLWDPTLLAFVGDSVLAASMTFLANETGSDAGVYGLIVNANNGIPVGTRLIRLRFKVVSPMPAYAVIQVTNVEARSTTGVLLRTFEPFLFIRIP
jgi:hypothetical protein